MYLGLDIGTTNVKALVVDERGSILACASRPVSLLSLDGEGVEQDFEEIWRATLAALGEAAAAVDARGVRAVGVSSQGGALQVLGSDGSLVGRTISWLDGRGLPDDERLTETKGRGWFAERTGHPSSGLAIGQTLRLRRQGVLTPERSVRFVGDLVAARLCGRAAHDGTSAALTLLYNPALRDYDPDVLGLTGLDATRLPDLLPPEAPAGALLPDAARETGLPAGIPVSAAVHDQYAAALGCRAVHAGDVMFGAGTAWVLLAVSDRAHPPVTQDALTCHHVVEGLYGQILSLRNGGSAFQWALGSLNLHAADGAAVDGLLQSVPPGSEGVTFWPFLAPSAPVGARQDAQGRFAGLRLAHGPAHLLRAVVEGLVCELSRHLAMLCAAGMVPARLRMCGRAANSHVTPQIVADVTGLPVDCLGGEEGSALGAAILARRLAEPGQPLADQSDSMSPSGTTVHPGKEAAAYADVYRRYLQSDLLLRHSQ